MSTRAKIGRKRRQKPGQLSVQDVDSRGANANFVASAKDAGLRYVTDTARGLQRKRAGRAFRYVDSNGRPVTDADTLARIQSLAIPPAWERVWICASANGHIQAVGYDARGRKQYRYHPKWREVRDGNKYDRMLLFAKTIPVIRRQTARHLKLPGLPREKVLAAIVRLLETTFIRVGNESYAKNNKSYGLTTIRNRHVRVRGKTIHFEFRGKSGVEHTIDLEDARLAKIVKQCQDLPEQELFEYIDAGGIRHDITSTDVNSYLNEITGHDFTAKDFRTWAGTVLAALALQEFESFDSQTQAKKNLVAAIEAVAKRLGNTKAVCRKCYIHPAIIESYLDGSLAQSLKERAEQTLSGQLSRLPAEEAAVLALLQGRLKREAGKRQKAA